MPWKLAPDEETVRLEIRLPHSMKAWLDSQPRGASATIRTMVRRAMAAKTRRARREEDDLVT